MKYFAISRVKLDWESLDFEHCMKQLTVLKLQKMLWLLTFPEIHTHRLQKTAKRNLLLKASFWNSQPFTVSIEKISISFLALKSWQSWISKAASILEFYPQPSIIFSINRGLILFFEGLNWNFLQRGELFGWKIVSFLPCTRVLILSGLLTSKQ